MRCGDETVATSMSMKKRKLIIFILAVGFIVILDRVFHFSSYISLGSAGIQRLKTIAGDNYVLAGLMYLGISIIGYSLLALPGVTFAIAAGLIFNPLIGTFLCLIAATFAACISFVIGRFFLKDSIKSLIIKNRHLKKWIFERTDKNYVFVLMLTRLIPIFPYNLQNFAYGVSDIPFLKYMLFSFIFMIPGTALYTFGTAGLVDASNKYVYLGLSCGLAIFVIGINRLLQKKYMQEVPSNAKEPPAVLPQKNKPCISCKICTTRCGFLRKYDLDFNDEEKLHELAYHCFLCGTCTDVCPHGVDGRAFMLDVRRMKVRDAGGKMQGYFLLQMEKTDYLFKNYTNGTKKTVLFPGCNYPSFYPETLDMLIKLFAPEDIGLVFDCCGKPIAELGLTQKENEIYQRLNTNLKKHGVEEIITMCPNCYYHLQGKLNVKVITVYEKLHCLGLGRKLPQNEITVFLPCPDRKDKQWIQTMQYYLPKTVRYIKSTQCCGLGGCAAAKEPALAQHFSKAVNAELEQSGSPELFVYCATCAGNFKRNGINSVRHILNEILGSDEVPAVKKSLINRAKRKCSVYPK